MERAIGNEWYQHSDAPGFLPRCVEHVKSWLPLLYRFGVLLGLVRTIRGNPVTDSLPISPTARTAIPPAQSTPMRTAAERLEASFLAEMLKSAGFGEQENSFSGSTGEDQFASFHREALALQMVRNGGIGLAEVFYQSLMEKTNDA
ncbi:MAG: rod-binding protein [Roseovarius sp.]|nr:rod-binding protein [Roseovarius sp.]